MISLREAQQRAYRAILLDDDRPLAAIVGVTPDAAVRLEVYRNNARETFRKTLAATYPVVERLVGSACFRGLAYAYMREFPSRSGDLAQFGAEFPELLLVFYRDTPFAYLADVACLEWRIALVETAAVSRPLDAAKLARVAIEDYPELRFELQGAARFVSSRFPVLTIWETNQAEQVEPVDLGRGAEHVLVLKLGDRVRLVRLAAGTFAFAVSLAAGESLLDAQDSGLAAERTFDAEAALRTLFELQILVDFRSP